jgi:hypothetical protein
VTYNEPDSLGADVISKTKEKDQGRSFDFIKLSFEIDKNEYESAK